MHDLGDQKTAYHQNIRIEDNTFEHCKLPLVWARSAANVRLKGNKLVDSNDRFVLDHADVKAE